MCIYIYSCMYIYIYVYVKKTVPKDVKKTVLMGDLVKLVLIRHEEKMLGHILRRDFDHILRRPTVDESFLRPQKDWNRVGTGM